MFATRASSATSSTWAAYLARGTVRSREMGNRSSSAAAAAVAAKKLKTGSNADPATSAPPVKRSFVPVPSAYSSSGVSLSSFRLVQYNILGDGTNLALSSKHGYCPMKHRVWGDVTAGRCRRLLSEILSYEADVLCLQEVSLRAFEKDLQPALAQKGYEGVHVSEHVAEFKSNKDAITLAVFVRSAKFKVLSHESLQLRDAIASIEEQEKTEEKKKKKKKKEQKAGGGKGGHNNSKRNRAAGAPVKG